MHKDSWYALLTNLYAVTNAVESILSDSRHPKDVAEEIVLALNHLDKARWVLTTQHTPGPDYGSKEEGGI